MALATIFGVAPSGAHGASSPLPLNTVQQEFYASTICVWDVQHGNAYNLAYSQARIKNVSQPCERVMSQVTGCSGSYCPSNTVYTSQINVWAQANVEWVSIVESHSRALLGSQWLTLRHHCIPNFTC